MVDKPDKKDIDTRIDDIQSSVTSVQFDMVAMKSDQKRILEHHEKFYNMFSRVEQTLGTLNDKIHEIQKANLSESQKIKDELHGRINMILFSILGGAFMFIAGVVMWVVQTKAGTP